MNKQEERPKADALGPKYLILGNCTTSIQVIDNLVNAGHTITFGSTNLGMSIQETRGHSNSDKPRLE